MRPALLRLLALSLAHFAAAMAAAVVAFGLDLDRLRSRTPLSRAAGGVHDVLMFPHDALLRALPRDWPTWSTPVPVPLLLLLVSSLLWGGALYGAWRTWRWSRGGAATV